MTGHTCSDGQFRLASRNIGNFLPEHSPNVERSLRVDLGASFQFSTDGHSSNFNFAICWASSPNTSRGLWASSKGHLWLSRYCDGGAVQIEHILPQTPTDLVKAEFGAGADDPTRVWSVGNLALAESAINQSLGNRPFSHKRTIYPQSQFLLTRAISERRAKEVHESLAAAQAQAVENARVRYGGGR